MISITESERKSIKHILDGCVPNCEVLVFGSRIREKHKPYSDLDIAVRNEKALPFETLAVLQEAFQASDISFRVDVLDYHSISKSFREVIDAKYEIF